MSTRQASREPRPNGPPIVDASRFQPRRRRQLSGPGLRTFLNIADEWQLSEQERLRVLGFPARSTFHGWIAKVRQRTDITLSVDELIRISAVLGIYKALKIIFPREEDAVRWLRAPNAGPTFGGQAPLALITSGTQDALMLVRRYLDAWRGGTFAAPVPGFDDAVAPLSDADLAFV
jgi:uncharacterized protein (DUF2384 family)